AYLEERTTTSRRHSPVLFTKGNHHAVRQLETTSRRPGNGRSAVVWGLRRRQSPSGRATDARPRPPYRPRMGHVLVGPGVRRRGPGRHDRFRRASSRLCPRTETRRPAAVEHFRQDGNAGHVFLRGPTADGAGARGHAAGPADALVSGGGRLWTAPRPEKQ